MGRSTSRLYLFHSFVHWYFYTQPYRLHKFYVWVMTVKWKRSLS